MLLIDIPPNPLRSAQDLEPEILALLDVEASKAKLAVEEAEKEAKGKKEQQRGPRRCSVSSETIDPKKELDLSKIPKVEKSADVVARIEKSIEGHLLFRALDTETRTALILSMTERQVKTGEKVISQGEEGDFFYIVDSGTLDCFVKGADDDTPGRKVTDYTTGASFGELALMYNTPRAATVIASTDSSLFAIEREVFRTLILARYMAKRVRFEQILETVPILQSMSSYERSTLADAFEEQVRGVSRCGCRIPFLSTLLSVHASPIAPLVQKFNAGTAIIREGDSGSTFYILLEGDCQATQVDEKGSQQVIKSYSGSRGEYFGELALLNDNLRAASVKATTDCSCILLDKWSFERLLGPVKEILERDADNYAKHI